VCPTACAPSAAQSCTQDDTVGSRGSVGSQRCIFVYKDRPFGPLGSAGSLAHLCIEGGHSAGRMQLVVAHGNDISSCPAAATPVVPSIGGTCKRRGGFETRPYVHPSSPRTRRMDRTTGVAPVAIPSRPPPEPFGVLERCSVGWQAGRRLTSLPVPGTGCPARPCRIPHVPRPRGSGLRLLLPDASTSRRSRSPSRTTAAEARHSCHGLAERCFGRLAFCKYASRLAVLGKFARMAPNRKPSTCRGV
jgi:hypothetical protein